MKHSFFRLMLFLNISLTTILLSQGYLSLKWRITHDSPIIFYMGWLESKFGFIPYRDFFDMNMPGAHWISALIGSIFGFSDIGYRRADLLILSVTLILIFIWLRSFGNLISWGAAVTFGLVYLSYGPGMSLQREFLIIPFVLATLLIFPKKESSNTNFRYLTNGIIIGLSMLIKPIYGLLCILLIPILLIITQDKTKRVIALLYYLTGFVIPLAISLIYLALNYALPQFFEISTRYWPLYTAIDGNLAINTGKSIFIHFWEGSHNLGLFWLWLSPASFSLWYGIFKKERTQENYIKILLMAAVAISSFSSIVISNKYWEYHWIPLITILIMLGYVGISFISQSFTIFRFWIPIFALLAALVLTLRPSNELLLQIRGQPLPPPQGGRVDEITRYLNDNLKLNDTVQPLDWSNGAVHAMLQAKARPASRYLYDFHFYHNVSNPEIKFLREDLINQLSSSHPRIIIQFVENRPWVNGPDTTREFPELENFIAKNYYLDKDRNGYKLWMRNN